MKKSAPTQQQSALERPVLPAAHLSEVGINLQAVFDIESLPVEIRQNMAAAMGDTSPYRQLILFAHGGGQLWSSLNSPIGNARQDRDNPIDAFSTAAISDYLKTLDPKMRFTFLYPKHSSVPLQQLGALMGWHHQSPLKIGINSQWGLWFAYRAAVLVDSNFAQSKPLTNSSPCNDCAPGEVKPCVKACPAHAMDNGDFDLEACMDYRLEDGSQCANRCIARNACPVRVEHRYSDEQMHYHYDVSLKMIARFRAEND